MINLHSLNSINIIDELSYPPLRIYELIQHIIIDIKFISKT